MIAASAVGAVNSQGTASFSSFSRACSCRRRPRQSRL